MAKNCSACGGPVFALSAGDYCENCRAYLPTAAAGGEVLGVRGGQGRSAGSLIKTAVCVVAVCMAAIIAGALVLIRVCQPY